MKGTIPSTGQLNTQTHQDGSYLLFHLALYLYGRFLTHNINRPRERQHGYVDK
jgi:hypothetical protein